LVTQGAKEVDFPYFVFSIETNTKRDDWREIQDLRDAYNNIITAIRAREPSSISTFFDTFEVLITTHPDIILNHANLIVKEVKDQQVDPWLKKLSSKGKVMPDPPIFTLEDIKV
jgi:hypothetical protein